ncbi:hypothetical protein [Tissierella praeacuta]|uniref:hypothetical protein n=1 Tax=Tissierella praeacuta TaxID=43131 RepID=UPI002FDA19EA
MSKVDIDMEKVLMNAKTVKIHGEDYVLQKLPPRQALELREQWYVDGVPNELKMFELVLEHIVIKPKVTIDDFEDVVVVEDLVKEAMQYQYKTKGK